MTLPKRLRKRGNAFYYDAGGKPRRWIALGTDEKTALRRYEKMMALPARPGTIEDMLREHLAALKLAPGSHLAYRNWAKHVGGVFGHMFPADLTHADILQYLEDCPRTSARSEIAVLSGAYWRWVKRRRVEFNPCAGVRCKRPRAKRTRLISGREIDAALAKADPHLAIAIELAFATGLRISDLCAMRWADIDGDAHQMGIRTAKTGVRQAFELTADLDSLLGRARRLQHKVASLYVLCQRGGRPWDRHSLYRRWRIACDAAGVKDATFHDLRAAAATSVDAEGGDAQRFLGHTDARTTAVYLRGRKSSIVAPAKRRMSTA